MDIPDRARAAALQMMAADDADRRAAVEAIATRLEAAAGAITQANEADLAAGEAEGLDPALLQRLALGPDKLATTIDGIRQVAALPNPVGRTLRSTDLDDGLRLIQHTVPLGVVACIFESRPDVAIQIPALTVRSGNAVILKGGREARRSNAAIIDAVRRGLADAGLPADAVQAVEGRDAAQALLARDDAIDLVVPRGSNDLVRSIQAATRIPVMGHAAGVCHVYIDAAADNETAERIVIDAKLDYPSACNAAETLLVHDAQRHWFDAARPRFEDAGIRLVDTPYGTEHGSPEMNVAFVADLDAALAHIARHGSHHTDCIVTQDRDAARAFLDGVDSAGVFVNASTRFADGYRYGLGAEVGISTGKLHARGPVGLDGLVSTRWVLIGQGHTVADFKDRPFLHRPNQATLQDALP